MASSISVRAARQMVVRTVTSRSPAVMRTTSRNQPDALRVWLLLLVVGLLGVPAVTVRRRYRMSAESDTDIHGSVSERWLAEQRGNKRD